MFIASSYNFAGHKIFLEKAIMILEFRNGRRKLPKLKCGNEVEISHSDHRA